LDTTTGITIDRLLLQFTINDYLNLAATL